MSTNNSPATLSEGRVAKIIQIHPSLQCNLFCKHCYSSSAPHLKGGLDVNALLYVLQQARELDYNVVSLSGGEPFMYQSLDVLLTETRKLGYFNSVTSNGMLLRSAFAARVMEQLDLIAISIDGKEPAHDALRGLPGAYKKMMEGLAVAKDAVPRFGLIHTVQPQSWKLFHWLAELAIEKGASLLHLHPLELAGRAADFFAGEGFSHEDLHKTFITHFYLSTYYAQQLFIQLDLLHRDDIRNNPSFCFHTDNAESCRTDDFSSLFRELIIDEDGDILPIAHGCSKYFRIGHIHEPISLQAMVQRFMRTRFAQLIKVYQLTYEALLEDPLSEIFNWSELAIKNTYCVGKETQVRSLSLSA